MIEGWTLIKSPQASQRQLRHRRLWQLQWGGASKSLRGIAMHTPLQRKDGRVIMGAGSRWASQLYVYSRYNVCCLRKHTRHM